MSFVLYSLDKLCSEQTLWHSLWKKVRRLEKSTPVPLVALLTNNSYAVRWCISQGGQSYPIQSIPSLRFECSIPDLINYVMLLSSFPFFKSFQSAINSHLCSLYHSDILPSLLMVLLYLVIGKKNPVINSTHRHKSDKEMIIQILKDRHLNDNMRMQTQMIHLVKFLKKWSP